MAGTDKRMLYYRDFNNNIEYYSSRKSYLKNLRFKITTPLGIELTNLNNYLELNNIQKTQINSSSGTNPFLFHITTKVYFSSEEYSIGDTLIFKNINLTNKYLEKFLRRKEGHTIIGLETPNNDMLHTKLYKGFYIPLDYTNSFNADIYVNGISQDAKGKSEVKPEFQGGVPQTMFYEINTDIKSIAINVDLQTTLSLKITTEERDNQILHTNII